MPLAGTQFVITVITPRFLEPRDAPHLIGDPRFPLSPSPKPLQWAAMSTTPATYDTSDPIIARLEDQIKWYDAKSSKSQKIYKCIKVIEIVAAALIPFLSALHLSD